MEITDRTRLFEIIAAAITGVGKIVFINLIDLRLPYIILTVFGWLGYIIYRHRQQPDIVRYWGLDTENFKKSFLQLLPVALVLAAGFVGAGYYFQTEVLDWSLLFILLLYPIWGVLQQFLVLGIYARNLSDGWGGQRSEALVIGLTAVLFAVIHYPSPLLIGATFILAIVYTWLFLRGNSILALGIYHGWLGGLFFYTLLGRNPWLEAFGAG